MRKTTALARIRFLSMKGESLAPRPATRSGNGILKVNERAGRVKRIG